MYYAMLTTPIESHHEYKLVSNSEYEYFPGWLKHPDRHTKKEREREGDRERQRERETETQRERQRETHTLLV